MSITDFNCQCGNQATTFMAGKDWLNPMCQECMNQFVFVNLIDMPPISNEYRVNSIRNIFNSYAKLEEMVSEEDG